MGLRPWFYALRNKQNDLKKAAEHFDNFLKDMKPFCQNFLDEKSYFNLEKKDAFSNSSQFESDKEKMKHYLHKSQLIFAAIYGENHPFVRDYVMVHGK